MDAAVKAKMEKLLQSVAGLRHSKSLTHSQSTKESPSIMAANKIKFEMKSDVDAVIPGLRVVADDLLHLAKLK